MIESSVQKYIKYVNISMKNEITFRESLYIKYIKVAGNPPTSSSRGA